MTAEHFKFPRNTSYRSCTGIRAKRIVPVETNEPKMCLNSAVSSKFSNKFHRVHNLKTMEFKRSAVRSRLSPPSENTEEKSPVFLFCTVHGRTADLLRLNPSQRNPLRAAAERPEPSVVRTRLSPKSELSRTPCGFGTVLVLLWAEKRPDF